MVGKVFVQVKEAGSGELRGRGDGNFLGCLDAQTRAWAAD